MYRTRVLRPAVTFVVDAGWTSFGDVFGDAGYAFDLGRTGTPGVRFTLLWSDLVSKDGCIEHTTPIAVAGGTYASEGPPLVQGSLPAFHRISPRNGQPPADDWVYLPLGGSARIIPLELPWYNGTPPAGDLVGIIQAPDPSDPRTRARRRREAPGNHPRLAVDGYRSAELIAPVVRPSVPFDASGGRAYARPQGRPVVDLCRPDHGGPSLAVSRRHSPSLDHNASSESP
jgi:hypothetical protein